MSTEFELLTLRDIFDDGKRQFSVPDYQRGYSWEEEQRKDLLGDIEQISHQQHRHFTGTIVVSRQGNLSVFDLVDGQQRVTSLVILVSCLVRRAQSLAMPTLGEHTLGSIREIYIRSTAVEGNTRYCLQLGDIRDPLFQEVLNSGHPINQEIKNKADQNIVNAASQFDEFLEPLSPEFLSKMYISITTKLGFLLYAPKQDAEIGLMFEVINNRGKPLSELEKIKNYLIYFAARNQIGDLKDKVNSCWPILLHSLNLAGYTSNDDENRFLRICWIVFEDQNKSRSHHVYDNLKLRYSAAEKSHWQKLSLFVDFIVSCAKTYANLYNTKRSHLSLEESRYLQRIALHPGHASILPLLVALYAKEPDVSRRVSTLDLIEKLNFRYYVTGIATRNDSGQGTLFWLAHAFYQVALASYYAEPAGSDWLCLQSRLVKFVADRANDHKFVQSLTLDRDESGDYHGWKGLKFFLGSYEDFLLSRNNQSERLPSFVARRDKANRNDFYHLEHIWAAKDYAVVNDAGDRNVNKRRIGNFILLIESLNIKASNARPEIKVNKYFEDTKLQPNTLMIRELIKDFEQSKSQIVETSNEQSESANYWYAVYRRFLDIREQRLVNFALKRWQIEGITRPVEKVIIDSSVDGNEVFKCLPDYTDKINIKDDAV